MANKKQLGQFKKWGWFKALKKIKRKTNKGRAVKHFRRSKHMWHKGGRDCLKEQGKE